MTGIPLTLAILVADHLRVAAIGVGIPIEEGRHFGLHNLRLAKQLAINKAKTGPKMVQGLLRHSRTQAAPAFYAQEDGEGRRAFQREFLAALGMRAILVL